MSKDNTNRFELWLEFEHVDFSDSDMMNEFCNIHVDLPDGRHYGISVWTYKFLNTIIEQDGKSGDNLNGSYRIPPDLFVKELTRDCIEKAISDILKKGNLEDMLNSSVISSYPI